MNFLKRLILTICGFWNMYQLSDAMRAGGDRPLKDVPYWLIGWFSQSNTTEHASAPARACHAACIKEIRQRRREAELAGQIANYYEKTHQ